MAPTPAGGHTKKDALDVSELRLKKLADANAMPSYLDTNALTLNTKCPLCMPTFWLHSVRHGKSLQNVGCRICGAPWLFLVSGQLKVHDARQPIQRSYPMSQMEETKATPMNQTNESQKPSSTCGSSDCTRPKPSSAPMSSGSKQPLRPTSAPTKRVGHTNMLGNRNLPRLNSHSLVSFAITSNALQTVARERA